ncbi:MAG: hypothetical protein Q4F69_04105 [Bacteroidia bacterium]|nr:hypothetical protein [Bacteroidia bacterium]
MKKLSLIFAAMMIVLGLSQCRKPVAQTPGVPDGFMVQNVTANVSNGNGNSKVNINDNVASAMLDFTWNKEDNEELSVSSSTIDGVSGTLSLVGDGGENGTFNGSITMPEEITEEDVLTFTYWKGQAGETPDLTAQDGTLDGTNGIKKMLYLTGTAKYNKNGNYDFTMGMPYAIVKVDISDFGSTDGNAVTVTYGENVITIDNVKNTAADYYLMLPAGEKLYTFEVGSKRAILKWNLTANTYYTNKTNTGKAVIVTWKYVDFNLGSGLLWATYNVGASSPEEYGDYFAWGETTPYYSTLTPTPAWKPGKEAGYCYNSYPYCTLSGETGVQPYENGVLKPGYDPATANWSDGWRTPTKADFAELLAACEWSVYTENNVAGIRLTSKTESFKSIFLPFAGFIDATTHQGSGNENAWGDYWSSSIDLQDSAPLHQVIYDHSRSNAWLLNITDVERDVFGDGPLLYSYRRCRGFSIRAVKEK